MTAVPGELNASAVISLIDSGAYPPEVVRTIANGFLPLPQEDLVAVLAHLAISSDDELATIARTALADIPSRVILGFASNENIPAAQLESLIGATADAAVLEALIRNRAVSDEAIVRLARTAPPAAQEVIVINQSRILRAPQILEALLENPALGAEARRRALETREEFFEKKARIRIEEEAEPEIVEIPLEAIADLLEHADENEPAAPPPPLTELEKKDSKTSSVWAKLGFMSVSEKVKLAFRGDRMLRMLLVRDRNRLVCSAVMRNPRITENEVESIAGMRNVEEEVLRLISQRRDWMSKYAILFALCRNPKAPLGVVLPLINRLTLRDLKGLKDDKGVAQVVRETARRTYSSRTQKTG